MELSVVIVNYNSGKMLAKCISHLQKSNYFLKNKEKAEIIVIDNASKDESIEILHKKYPRTKIIRNSENSGFAKANNQGIRQALGKYVLLLNTDAFIREDSLNVLIDELVKNDQTGVVGCKLLNSDGSLQQSLGYFPSLIKIFLWMFFLDDIKFINRFLKPYHLKEEGFYLKRRHIDWVSGACMIVRRNSINKAGFLDENLFMYVEEVEWCFRIKKKGYDVLYTPLTEVKHLKGRSSIEKSTAGLADEFIGIKYLYKKHSSKIQLILVRVILKAGALLRMLIFGIIAHNPLKKNTYEKAFKLA